MTSKATTTTSITTPVIIKPGTICWTRRGSSSSSSSSSSSHDNIQEEESSIALNDVESTSNLWWPCIIYPSWSYAATESQLMPSSDDDDDDDSRGKNKSKSSSSSSSILIQGCRKPIAKIHLSRNMVPQKAALGRKNNPSPNKNKRRRVVAHLLGLFLKKRRVSNWAAVETHLLKPYRQHAMEMLSSYKNKLHRCDWIDFIRAMEEASVVLDDCSFHPRRLMEEMEEDGGGGGDGMTPEFFDDWHSGGESQSQSQRRSMHFSQAAAVVNYEGGMMMGGGNGNGVLSNRQPSAVSRSEECAPVDNNATTPLVKNKRQSDGCKMVRIVANVPQELSGERTTRTSNETILLQKSTTGGAVSTVTPMPDDDDDDDVVVSSPRKRKREEKRDGVGRGGDGDDRIEPSSPPASGEKSSGELQCFPGSSLLTQPCAEICEL